MNYTFKAENGHAPCCKAFGRNWYIMDRYIGGDKYEYCLMSRSEGYSKHMQFADKKAMANYLCGAEVDDDIGANVLLQFMIETKTDSGDMLLVKDGQRYVWKEQSKTLQWLQEPTQHTGYCETYNECLKMAKKILEEREAKENGEQLQLFE